jgi:hypothetical protein
MVDAFIHDDWAAYRNAMAWLRDFAHQKNIERGRVMCGSQWYTPQSKAAVKIVPPRPRIP